MINVGNYTLESLRYVLQCAVRALHNIQCCSEYTRRIGFVFGTKKHRPRRAVELLTICCHLGRPPGSVIRIRVSNCACTSNANRTCYDQLLLYFVGVRLEQPFIITNPVQTIHFSYRLRFQKSSVNGRSSWNSLHLSYNCVLFAFTNWRRMRLTWVKQRGGEPTNDKRFN